MMALTSQQSLINPMVLRDVWLVISLLFVLERGYTLVQIKKSWLYVLVVPYGSRTVINFELF